MTHKKELASNDGVLEKYLTFETCGFLDKYQVATKKGGS